MERRGEKASADDLNRLGEMYHFGYGVEQSFERAQDYYLQAVKKGSAVAANHLGRIYLNGEGVKANPEAAEKWYKKSVELDPRDENRCQNGQLLDRSFCALLKLAEQGNAQAMVATGENYLNGVRHGQELIVFPDKVRAKKWLIRAAKQGSNLKACWLLYKLSKEGLIPCMGPQEVEKWRKEGLGNGGAPLDFQ